jgi:hypothetical protein
VLQKIVNYGRKMLYDIGPCFEIVEQQQQHSGTTLVSDSYVKGSCPGASDDNLEREWLKKLFNH